MRDALLNILGVKGLLTDVKNSTYANHVLPIKSAPPKRNGQDWLKAYNESPRLAPVTKMSLDISTTKGNVYRVNKKTGTKVLVPNHPLLELLYQPNPYYNTSGSADLYLMQVHFIVRGEAFAIIERDANNEPSFLWLLPPDWVTDIPNKETPYYKVKGPSGNEFKVEQEDMFYRKNPNPINPIGRGIGRVEQIGDEIETDEYMAKFAKRFFFNDATPNIIVTAPDAAEDDEIRVAERRWHQKFGGVKNSNKAAFLNWEAKVHVLNTTNREMDFVESRKFYRDLSIQHYGIPPEIMGNVENSNKATVVAAQDIYLKQVIHPQLVEFEEVITWQLLKQFKNSENLVFEFNKDTVEDNEFEYKVISESFTTGGITINEYRKGINKYMPFELCDLPDKQGNKLLVKGKVTVIDLESGQLVEVDSTEDESTGGENNDDETITITD